MKRKPVYRYPEFVSQITLKSTSNKRYWLNLTIDEKKTEKLVVILKNPSRANQEVSDKTVYNVSNYIFRNRTKYQEFKDIGEIIILNLMPIYMTESKRLQNHKQGLIDPENFKILSRFCQTNTKVIIAWGNTPKGIIKEYEMLKSEVLALLKTHQNDVYYVDKLSLQGNPKHGQIWAYKDQLRSLKLL